MEPQLREELITQSVSRELAALTTDAQIEALDPGEASERLVRFAAEAIRRELRAIGESATPQDQAEWINRIVSPFLEDSVSIPPEMLYGIGRASELPPRPEVPLTTSDLLFNGAGQPRIGSELKAELRSAKNVDLICAFVIRSGLKVIRDELRGVIQRGGRVRVVTTSYMGATQPRALNELVELGAEVRVDFDARTTKLHAKSWLIEREGGLTTAFVGSSNLSHTALLDGLEWNVRLAEADSSPVIARIRTAFETCWENPHFEDYTAERELDLHRSLKRSGARAGDGSQLDFAGLDVTPYPHQSRILDRLAVERNRHDRHRNLVVAATGTGKTVVAALDYKRLRSESDRDLKLLFVAHRLEILRQARATYRHVLRDGNFGELLGDGNEPVEKHHVFAVVNSLTQDRLEEYAANHFDVVVVDEVHHGVAESYTRVLNHFEPGELLGMTATPERMDDKSVFSLFGDRVAYEMRLWEAIDEGFLAPFQYFGIADETDLRGVRWTSGDYNRTELGNVLTGDHARVAKIIESIQDIVDEPSRMRALGFCVTVKHAEFMAECFTAAGLSAVAVSGDTPTSERAIHLRKLAAGELRAVFSVDVFGEGVDVPDVDTVLLLRPTQSPTVLTQQIGRGLRLAEGKRCLTIIDPIGEHREQFRFDRRLRALLEPSRGPILKQLEEGFPFLPSGCEISLDRVSTERILSNLKSARTRDQWPALAEELHHLGESTLAGYLDKAARSIEDVYRGKDHGWTNLKRKARLISGEADPTELELLRAPGRMLHVDDPERCDFFSEVLSRDSSPRLREFNTRQQRLLRTLFFDLWATPKFEDVDAGLDEAWKHERVREELIELLDLLGRKSELLTKPSGISPEIPLHVHARYSKREALVAIKSSDRLPNMQGGVDWTASEKIDSLFVDINKSERDYSPSTMYNDYAISAERFHWESQSRTREDSTVGLRYRGHEENGSQVLLFMRERKGLPFWFLGPVSYVEHKGERPMAITWRMQQPIPESILAVSKPL